MTLSKFVFICCASFFSGVFAGSIIGLSAAVICGFFISSLILISILWDYKRIVFIGVVVLFFSLGLSRYYLSSFNLPLSGEISITGKISSEPEELERAERFKVGKFLIITDKYSGFQYGDKVSAKGSLENGFVLFFPEVEKIGEFEGGIYAGILKLKEKMREAIDKNFPSPQNMILGAMVLGDKHRMSSELKEKLNISGLRHITAISGLHISLIGSLLMLFFFSVGIGKSLSFYFSLSFLLLFIVIIGFPASAVRAGIMGGIYMLSQKTGRMNSGARTLFLAGAIMLLVNPLLVHDYGFKLSFLAVFGIINFSPVLRQKIPLNFLKQEELKEALFIALSAYLFTFPFLLYSFNQVSLVSVVSNILAVPFVYLIILFGILFLFFVLVFPLASFLFLIPLWVFLSVFAFIIEIFSRFPYLEISGMNILFLIAAYSLFSYFILKCNNE